MIAIKFASQNVLEFLVSLYKVIDDLDVGINYPSDETEYLGSDVMPIDSLSSFDRTLFYDLNDVRLDGSIIRAFDSELLEKLRRTSNPQNPFTKNSWPLNDSKEIKHILKIMPKS